MRDFLYRLLSAIILVILVIGVIWFILPDTVFSYPIEKLWSFCATIFHWQEYYRKGLQTEGAIAIFFGGYLLLLILLIIYGFCHFVLWDRISPTSHFTNAFALLSSCYLLDFFVSTADPYPFGELLWVFMVFSSFFLTMLYIGEEWALLLKVLVIAIGEQCLYAIIYYFLSFNQFHTPDFGNRTSGTFVNPGSLYPLCLIGFPISLILAEMEKSLHWRWLWRAMGGVSLLALTFTFTRTGWIAFAVSAGYLAFSPFSPLRSQRPARLMLVLLIVLALSGTAFVRTMGRPVGNPEDRSFWGRFAIWQTALHVIADHPLLGNGLNTYPQKQREHMTERLKYFNPLNVEAKKSLPASGCRTGTDWSGSFLLGRLAILSTFQVRDWHFSPVQRPLQNRYRYPRCFDWYRRRWVSGHPHPAPLPLGSHLRGGMSSGSFVLVSKSRLSCPCG